MKYLLVLRFLHEDSKVPYFKLGPKALVIEGKTRTTTAILFSKESRIAEPFLKLLKVKQCFQIIVTYATRWASTHLTHSPLYVHRSVEQLSP